MMSRDYIIVIDFQLESLSIPVTISVEFHLHDHMMMNIFFNSLVEMNVDVAFMMVAYHTEVCRAFVLN